MGDSNGALIEERLGPLSLSASSSSPPASSNPKPESVSADRWSTVEKVTQGIICQVRPTVVSDERRKAVVDYVQRLIRGYLGCEVFPFGSVPLKTYLPDGDIDLTAFGGANFEDTLSNDVFSVLEGEEQNNDCEFTVKDVQVVNAEVKLVKCLVQNIVVDISFNQLGGLCTLCFLEQVDRLIGKDHLFKRSIILIKAWCYYESRILGAHHGLISTYALETLVLYIFHLFHSCLDGPLAVLYRFLDYFSKFDWENYCVSVSGPVRISSLPDVTAEKPENGGLELLLNYEFLKECTDLFYVSSRGAEMTPRTFQQKHLNIVDPLKENNNLGRSVSKGNFYRIRSAFSYGARKLGQILLQPEENLADELVKFFTNTLDRHGSGRRPDVHDHIPDPESILAEKATRPVVSSEPANVENAPGISHDGEDIPDNVRLENLQILGGGENGASTSGKALHAPHMYLKRSGPFRVGFVMPASVSDLGGDLDVHFYNLQYGRYCYGEYGLSSPISQIALPTLTPVASWNSQRRPSHITRTVFPSGANGLVVPRPPFFPMNPPMLHSVAFGMEELPKPRGTGTYFPNTQHQLNRRRYPMGRVRNQVQARSPRCNGRAMDANSDWMQIQPSPKPHYPPDHPNGVLHRGVEFGSFARSKPLTSSGKLPNPIPSPSQSSVPSPRRKSASSSSDDKSSMYRLKDEEDFPPLSA